MIGLTGSLGFSEDGWRLGQELHLVSRYYYSHCLYCNNSFLFRGEDGLSFLASFNCDPGEQKLVVWGGHLGNPTVGLRLMVPLLSPGLGR